MNSSTETIRMDRTNFKDQNQSIPICEYINSGKSPCFYCDWSDVFKHYSSYAITIFGCLSNLMIIAVLGYSKRMLVSVSGILLLSLAVADTGVLIGQFILGLAKSPVLHHQLELSSLGCGAVSYLKYSARCAATLVILCISINRFVVIVCPMKLHRFKTRKCVIIQLVVMIVFSLAASLYGFELRYTHCYGCDSIEHSPFYKIGVTVIDTALCDFIASVAILVLSTWTVHVFRKFGRQMFLRKDSCASTVRREGERHMTILLVVVALSFVLMRMPYALVYTLSLFAPGFFTVSEVHQLSNLCECVALLNHAINLYLYCVCSRGFRDDVRDMFCLKGSRTLSRSNTVRMTTFRGRSKSLSSKSSEADHQQVVERNGATVRPANNTKGYQIQRPQNGGSFKH